MELRQLEPFLAVAEEQHFRRAAARHQLAQSALSKSIRALETDLGAQLFRRTTRRVELTDAGRALMDEARRTLAAASAARAAVSAVQGVIVGQLRVGAIPTPGLLDQARLLRQFHNAHAGITIQYVRDTSMVLLDDVLHGRLDLALISQPIRLPRQIAALPLLSEPIVLACPTGHPVARATTVTAADLAGETLIAAPAGSVGHDVIQAFSPAGQSGPNVPYVVNDVTAILDFVAAGLGLALVQETPVRARSDLVAVPLLQPVEWTLAIVTSESRGISVAAQALMSAIRGQLGTRSATQPAPPT